MKRIISIFLVLLIFLCSPAVAYADNSSATVYVTKSGEKYHRSGCRYLKQSCISLSLREAVENGYTACSVCNPLIPNFEYTVSRSRSHASGARHSGGSVETTIIVVLIALPILVHVYDEITFAKKRKEREALEEARRREIARRLRYEKAKLAEAQRRNSIQEKHGGKSYSERD